MLAVFGTINVFGTALVVLVFSRAALPDPNVPRGLMVGMMGGMALASAVAAGLGIWWLVLFNRAAVKGYFAGLATSIPDAPPIPRRVLIVAWMMVASVVAVPFLLFGSSAMPAYFFGIELQGPVRFAFLLTQVGVVVAAGVGLLRRRLGAHALAVGVYLFGLVNFGALLVTPGGLRRTLPASVSGSGAELPQEVVDLMFPALMVFSLALTLALVGLLWSARARYVRACLAPPPLSAG